ncbi:peptidoglycan DD-metalloendopeptidase family protein [Bacillus salitolerans]|uniref:Peptidoglycan DD-metalloendopeptidase family protein n=1 Tax=Bacillus salitolerans TaxID=1437434 RepID=A0ABW4LLW2_9BACI
MSQRAEEIRKRIARRKKERHQLYSPHGPKSRNARPTYLASDEERHGYGPFDTVDDSESSGSHPLFHKEWFMFKILASACLILVVAIIFRDGSDRFEPVQKFVSKTMESEFQFAAVTAWYEDQFGKPLALFPTNNAVNKQIEDKTPGYAVPAVGWRILENFEANGQGVMIETESESFVEAMSEGTVIYIGQKPDIGGITVVVQHSDGSSESWYGNLDSIHVNLYDFIEKGSKVGKAISNEDGVNSTFYFGIKEGDSFIDPIQVINFD